jgi:peptidoglycan/LPS O-acetylase OafA/YrhL
MRDGDAPYESFSRRGFFGSLDGLRAIAALMVVWHHCHQGLYIGQAGERLGEVGVELFFVLSGFLIVTLLIRERHRTGTIRLGAFYVRRALRIMPLYYAVVLGTAAVVFGILPHGPSTDALKASMPFLLTYTTNWVPVPSFLLLTWTLATEEQFYLVWPQLQSRVADSIGVPLVLLMISEAIRFRLLDQPLAFLGISVGNSFFLKAGGFTPILLGVLLAYILDARAGFRLANRFLATRRALPILVLAVFLVLEWGGEIPAGFISGAGRKLVLTLLLTCVIGATVIREDHIASRLLSTKFLSHLGVISYGIYLLHLPASLAVDAILPQPGPLLRLLLIVATTIFVAELSHRFFESRFTALKAPLGVART